MRKLIIVTFILIGTAESFAQKNFKGYYEPFIELGYNVTENYSHEFGVEERTIWYDNGSFKVDVKQIDLSHFSTLAMDDKNELAVGIQYRFEENFEPGEENELRLTEEYTYSIQPKIMEFEHRLRVEQRFTSSATSHRFRYNFAIARALKGPETERGEAYLLADMETLLTVAKTSKPEYEQRIGVGVGWVLTDYMEIELLTEYRLDNFTQDLGHELFFVTGLNFTL